MMESVAMFHKLPARFSVILFGQRFCSDTPSFLLPGVRGTRIQVFSRHRTAGVRSPFVTAGFILGCLLALKCFFPLHFASASEKKDVSFQPDKHLQKSPAIDDFESSRIKSKPGAHPFFDAASLLLFLKHSEAKINYDQFTAEKSVNRARDYIRTHQAALAHAEKKFGVGREIITAIILIETRLGTNTGKRPVLVTLSSLSALADPGIRDMFRERYLKSGRLTRADFEKWAKRKSKWAHNELRAFITYTAVEGIDPLVIRGSYAGALGIAQFMPSSVLGFGKDGNRDGRIDLFDHADAVSSIGNYLKRHGWEPNIDLQKARNVLMRYNHSRRYANTTLIIAELLKGS